MIYEYLSKFAKEFQEKEFKRSEVIYRENEFANNIYLVNEGIVGLFHLSEKGKETFLRTFGEKSIFGHRSYLAKTKYHASSMALTKVKVSVISSECFQRLTDKNPEILRKLLQELANDLGRAELRLAGTIDKSVTTRIIESLVYLKLKHPTKVWTRKEIADYSGSTFETVARVMASLDEKELIIKEGRDFYIPKPEELINYSKQEL